MFAAMITSIPALTLALFMAEVKQKPAYEMLDDRIVLKTDAGGDIDRYAEFFELVEKTRMPVWVTGTCSSACTMILRNPKACAMPNAVFGFHAARVYNKKTLEVMGDSDNGNRILWSHYPDKVKLRLGGRLGEQMVYMKGTELLPPCKPLPPFVPPNSRAYQAATGDLLPALSGLPPRSPTSPAR